MERSLPAAKRPITKAPIDQAPLYQPAARPTLKARCATPTVEAAPTARPVTLTATRIVFSLRPASKNAVEPESALCLTHKLMPKSNAMYTTTITN